MRNFSKKLAFVLAAAMVFTAFAPAAKADAAEKEMAMNRATQTLYVNEGVNDKGAETLPEGLYGNVQEYDFYVKNKPADYAKEYNFLWESDNEKVATVDQKGLTKAVAVGTATITCTITDKATDDEVAVAEAKVTVKANAAAVVITNAEDYDGTTLGEDRVVDLNRMMFAEGDKEGTTKRGVKVTDYTRWIAEDADGKAVAATVVAIDQATGKFTFAADAPAGDYTLYCQTYQSDKYNQTTAESEKVTVTVVEEKNTFEIEQKDLKKFEIVFDKAVTAADVSVVSVLPINGTEYEVPVNSKTTVKDNVATVELYNNVKNGQKFYFTVNGEKVDKVASVGKVVDIKVTADVNQGPEYPIVVAGGDGTNLVATLYDAAGVDVTAYYIYDGSIASVEYTEVTSTEEVAYMIQPDGLIWFEEAGNTVAIEVTFHTGETDDNGDEVGNVKLPFSFGSTEAATVKVEGLGSYTIKDSAGNDTKKMSIPLNTVGSTLAIKPVVTGIEADKTPEFVVDSVYSVGGVDYGTVVMEETDNNIFAIDRTNGEIYTFQEGKGKVVIYLITQDENGADVKTPVGVVDVEVTKANKLDSVKLERTSSTVGMVPGLDTDYIALVAKDYYKNDWTQGIGTVTVKAANTIAKNLSDAEVAAAVYEEDGKIVIEGSKLEKAFTNSKSNSVNPQFTVTIDNGVDKWEQTLSVVVKKVIATATPSYILEKTNGDWGEVSRTKNDNDATAQAAKSITFTVYETNNGVKVDGAVAGLYTDKANLTDADNGNLFIKVTKDGTDITNTADLVVFGDTTVASGSATTVTINFSSVDGNDYVTYNTTGAGSYAVVLYKANVKGNVKSYTTLKTMTGATTVNVGKYSYVGLANDTAASAEDPDLRACFTINGRDGNATTNANFTVEKTDSADSKTVFVKSITFVEEFDGVKVAYKVDINKAVKVQ